MSVEEFFIQNQLIVGLIIGTAATFIGYSIRESIQNYHFNKNIKKIIRIELEIYRDLLADTRTEATNLPSWKDENESYFIPSGNRLIHQIRDNMHDENRFHFSNYAKLSPETKAKVFNESVLTKLEEIQMELKSFRYFDIGTGRLEGFNFSRTSFDDITNSIDCVLTKL